MSDAGVRVEIWSDVVCPWCYIGKRRFETALGSFEHRDEVEVVWRSYQLDPTRPKGSRTPVYDMLQEKMGVSAAEARARAAQVIELAAAEGLTYDYDSQVAVNTVDAHRVAHLARTRGLGTQMHERLLAAQLCEGEVLDDGDTLVRLAAEVGVDEDATRAVLDGDAHLADVRADIREARQLGVSGVPFFVLDRRYGVSGAQQAETFLSALRTAHENR